MLFIHVFRRGGVSSSCKPRPISARITHITAIATNKSHSVNPSFRVVIAAHPHDCARVPRADSSLHVILSRFLPPVHLRPLTDHCRTRPDDGLGGAQKKPLDFRKIEGLEVEFKRSH